MLQESLYNFFKLFVSLLILDWVINVMMRNLNINRLSHDELSYEMAIRGMAIGTVDEMRKLLARVRKMEKLGDSFTYPEHPFTFEEDAQAVTAKVAELRKNLETLEGPKESGSVVRMESKTAHVLGRVDRMVVSSVEEKDAKSKLLSSVMLLMADVVEKIELFKECRQTEETPSELSILENSMEGVALSPQRAATKQQSSSIPLSTGTKSVPVSKWGLRFTGDKKGMSVNAFLERVNELKIARHSSDEDLFDAGVDLFAGRALLWYRDARQYTSTWTELITKLKEEFQPQDYNEKLLEEIKRRTQGADESIGIYLAVMSAMFGRLNCPVSEAVRLKILMKNISPIYQTQLALVDVTSIEQLKTLCRRLEARREAAESFTAPPRKSLLEPDLAYAEVTIEAAAVEVDAGPSTDSSNQIRCFNCNLPGHKAIGCTAPKIKKCYKCQKVGFTVRTCPTCNAHRSSGNGAGRQ